MHVVRYSNTVVDAEHSFHECGHMSKAMLTRKLLAGTVECHVVGWELVDGDITKLLEPLESGKLCCT